MKNLFLLLVIAASTLAHAASSPTLIPFQGRLTDQVGTPYTNGQYTLIFNLYDQAVGGNVLWTETHQKVGVINGTVNVFLGSINAALASLDFSQTRHLGITIDPDNNPNTPDPEMVPRQMIIPAFWAKNAEKLAGQDWTPLFGVNSPTGSLPGSKIAPLGITDAQLAANSVVANKIADGQITAAKLSAQLVLDLVVPAGSVQAFAGSTIPGGWLLCDGKALSRLDFPRLYTAIGTNWGAGFELVGSNLVKGTNDFNLPDLRGLFLRGVTGSRTNQWGDSSFASRTNLPSGGNLGNSVGSLQADMVGPHFHLIEVHIPNGGNGKTPGGSTTGTLNGEGYSRTIGNDGIESRPKNAYVHYIIKY